MNEGKDLNLSNLLDYYADMLTDKQKDVIELYYNEDMSLGEIAGEYGISRQGVHDLIKRCDNTLQEYENKLHLVSRFMTIKEKIEKINRMAGNEELSRKELAEGIRQLSGEILEEL